MKDALKRLFDPQTIAFIGGDSAAEAIRRCKAIGYRGDIHAVNPKREELGGVRCLKSIADLTDAPDAAFIAAPPEATIGIVRDLRDRGAGGAVCYAAGFAELGEAGKALQQELRDAARGMAVVGPNCHGFLNFLDGVALWPDLHGGARVDRGVALVSQSGNVGINLSMQQRGFDFGYVVTVGNKSCLEIHDYIDFFLDDPRVTAIGLYIEALNDIDRFTASAIAALDAGVPIVAMKTGRSEQGKQINLSHTASLSGEDRLYDALFRRYGVARCDTIPQFLETLKFVSTVGALPEATLGSMSCSGGEASMIADCADAVGLALPPLSDATKAKLADVLGPKVPLSNPLDYHTYAWGHYDKLYACFSAMLENGNACTILVLDYAADAAGTENWQVAERALTDAIAASGERAVIVSTLPETMPAEVRARLRHAGIAAMQGLEDSIHAIGAAAVIGAARKRRDALVPLPAVAAADRETVVLDEWQGKEALKQAGVPVPRGALCEPRGAATLAGKIGYPVVVKAVSAELPHKTEHGAVALGLRKAKAVTAAAKSIGKRWPRLLVEEMVGPVVAEILVGVKRDDTFGVTMLIGAGGALVELLDDTATLLLPVTRDEVEQSLGELKVAKLLAGHRGKPAGDVDAMLDAIMAIVDYVEEHRDSIVELDVNPLIVTPTAAVAADALIRLQAERTG